MNATSPKKGYLKWLIGGGILAMAIAAVTQLNLGDHLVYFYVPEEVAAKKQDLQGQLIKVGAMVKEGTVDWQAKDLLLRFTITDFEGHEFAVEHRGIKPDMFKENQGVVVEGRMSGDLLVAQTLMVKHSEEYKKPDGQHGFDKELLKKSIFKP